MTYRRNALSVLAILLAFAASAYAQDVEQILRDTAARYNRAWSKAHHEGDPERWDYIILACDALWQADPQGRYRCNWRRGVVGDLSMDGLSISCPDGRWYFADIIVGAGGSNPQINYRSPCGNDSALLRNAAGQYIGEAGAPTPAQIRQHHGWTHYDYSGGGGTGGVDNPHPFDVRAEIEALKAQLVDLRNMTNDLLTMVREVSENMGATRALAQDTRAMLDLIHATQITQTQMLQNPPAYKGRILGLSITFRPAP